MTKTKLFPSQRLHEQLKALIGAAEPGQKLPSEPELARQMGVARATLREAMRVYESQGLLYRRQGAGTIVLRPQVIDSGLEVLESIETLASRIGLEVRMDDLKVQEDVATNEEAAALGLATASSADMADHRPQADLRPLVVRVARTIWAEGHPAAYLVDILPQDILTPADLKEGFTGSVLDLLLRRGNPRLGTSRTELNAVVATPDIAKALGLQRGDVLLRFISQLYDTTGRVVDYSFSYFLPGYFKFHIVRKVDPHTMLDHHPMVGS